MSRYGEIAKRLRSSLTSGGLGAGQKFISARKLADRERVSLPTAVSALRVLEAEGRIVARPRSGYFVCTTGSLRPTRNRPPSAPLPVGLSALALEITSRSRAVRYSFASASPQADWLPITGMRRALAATMRDLRGEALLYSAVPGNIRLRRQLASLASAWGADLSAEDLIVTAGATQALRLALRAVCSPGDVVAVESPTYFGLLLLIESLGLKALEVPTDPESGLDVEALAGLLRKTSIAAVIACPTVQNPLGTIMSLAAKQALVKLLDEAHVPLIEDDVYGDLATDRTRPPACKSFDSSGNVLYCSSISKTLAPGWRIGWLAAGRFHERATVLRWEESLAGSPILEAALAEFLASGDYRRHLRQFRGRIEMAVRGIAARVEATFPNGTRISRPEAGFLLWIELPQTVDVETLHRRALSEGIGIAPGQIFSPRNHFRHHFRLSCAQSVSPQLLNAVDRLAALARRLA